MILTCKAFLDPRIARAIAAPFRWKQLRSAWTGGDRSMSNVFLGEDGDIMGIHGDTSYYIIFIMHITVVYKYKYK